MFILYDAHSGTVNFTVFAAPECQFFCIGFIKGFPTWTFYNKKMQETFENKCLSGEQNTFF